jgi:hypothetical protein
MVGWIMNNVLRLRPAGERARQPSGGPNGQALSVWNPQTPQLDGQSAGNQRLFERLEAENARLRTSVVDLMLQIQALRDGASPFRHRAHSQRSLAGYPSSSRHAENFCSLASFFKLDLLKKEIGHQSPQP